MGRQLQEEQQQAQEQERRSVAELEPELLGPALQSRRSQERVRHAMGKLGTATCSEAWAEAQHTYVQLGEQEHKAVEDDDAGEQSMAVDER